MSYSVRLGCREPASEQRKEVVNQRRAGLCVSSKLALPWEPPLKDLSLCSTGAFQQALLGCQAEVSRKNRQTTSFQFNFFLQICLMNLFFFYLLQWKDKNIKSFCTHRQALPSCLFCGVQLTCWNSSLGEWNGFGRRRRNGASGVETDISLPGASVEDLRAFPTGISASKQEERRPEEKTPANFRVWDSSCLVAAPWKLVPRPGVLQARPGVIIVGTSLSATSC